jgi:hypothetical protein
MTRIKSATATKSLLARLMWAAALAASASASWAWSGHALCSWQALGAMPEIGDRQVNAESLEAFVAAERERLAKLLDDQEAWSRANLKEYPARPDALAFKPDAGDPAQLRARFLQALRLNGQARLKLFVQLRPGEAAPDRPRMPWVDITALRSGTAARENSYVMLREGEAVSVLNVVSTASAEPDYALDIGLWADNGTAQGQAFGLGKQPFGNPAVDYSSQAPFHMGFFHEAAIVYAAAGFLRRTHVEYRIHLFRSLAGFAFASGHPYWGWRFAGWAMHYVQDLTQPYHARVLPGVGTARMLWINAADMLGFPRAKNEAINLVTNRHWVIEAYQFERMRKAYERADFNDALLRALRDTTGDSQHRVYTDASARDLVSAEAAAAADELDRVLESSFPAQYTSDASRVLGNSAERLDMDAVAQQAPAAQQAALEQQVAAMMLRLGRHSRALVRAVLLPAAR